MNGFGRHRARLGDFVDQGGFGDTLRMGRENRYDGMRGESSEASLELELETTVCTNVDRNCDGRHMIRTDWC